MDRLRDIIGEYLYNYHYHQAVNSLLQYFSPCSFGLYYYFSVHHCSDHLNPYPLAQVCMLGIGYHCHEVILKHLHLQLR